MNTNSDLTLHQRPAELLQKLIQFDTTNPPGNEFELIVFLKELFNQYRIDTQVLAKTPQRPNLLARLPGQGMAPPLLLYGHVDVVTTQEQQWSVPPFEGKLQEGYIWGRGALDMKSGVAMMAAAVLRAKAEGFQPAGDIFFLAECDEEAGSDFGMKFLVEEHAGLFKNVRYALSEFGGFPLTISGRRFYLVQVAEKQICWMQLKTRGMGGHASLPLRDGAMAKLGQVLLRLNHKRLPVHITPAVRQMFLDLAGGLPFPQNQVMRLLLHPPFTDSLLDMLGEQGRLFEPLLHNTVNATVVRGGEKVNVVPSEITLALDGRLLPGYNDKDMLAELRQVLGMDIDLEVVLFTPGPGEPDMGLFGLLSGVLKDIDPQAIPMAYVMPGVTDAAYLSRLGIQTYGFTPMNLPAGFDFFNTIHAADERIPVSAVEFGSHAVYEVVKRYL